MSLVRAITAEQGMLKNSGPVTMQSICRVIATRYNLSILDLKGKSRSRQIVRPRQIAMYLIKDYFGKSRSYPEIGRYLGGRDHATVIHGCRLVQGLMDTDSRFAAEVLYLKSLISESDDSDVNNHEHPDVLTAADSDNAAAVVGVITQVAEPEISLPVVIIRFNRDALVNQVATYFSVKPIDLEIQPTDKDSLYCWKVFKRLDSFLVRYLYSNVSDENLDAKFAQYLTETTCSLSRKDMSDLWEIIRGRKGSLS